MRTREIIKQDINFLEYPMWMQDGRMASNSDGGFIWKDRDGFTYRAGYRPPTKTDIIFLYYLLLRSQRENWVEEIELTRYRILCDCGITPGKKWFVRLEDSLQRWLMVKIEFQGKFYDGREYQTINFGIIDSWSIEKRTNKLRVRFSPEWQLKIRESDYFKMIDFNVLRSLKSPLVIRLYEILVKSFQGRERWEVDALRLAQKIPMNERYPADIIPKIKDSIQKINERSTLSVKLNVRRPRRGEAIFLFRKIAGENYQTSAKGNSFQALLEILPEQHRNKKTILETISTYYLKKGYDYVARNICYTNQRCTNNYRAYLAKSLKEDWGVGLLEDEEDGRALQAEEGRKEDKKREQSDDTLKQVREYISTLPQEEQEKIRAEAIQTLPEWTQDLLKKCSAKITECIILSAISGVKERN